MLEPGVGSRTDCLRTHEMRMTRRVTTKAQERLFRDWQQS